MTAPNKTRVGFAVVALLATFVGCQFPTGSWSWHFLLLGLNLLALSAMVFPPVPRSSPWFGAAKTAVIFVGSLGLTVFTTTTLNHIIDVSLVDRLRRTNDGNVDYQLIVLWNMAAWCIAFAALDFFRRRSIASLGGCMYVLLAFGVLGLAGSLYSTRGSSPKGKSALERLDELAITHAERVFILPDEREKYAYNLGATLFWTLIYGDPGFSNEISTDATNEETMLLDIDQLRDRYGWHTLTSPRLFGDGQLPSQPFRELDDIEWRPSTNGEGAQLEVPVTEWLQDGQPELNLAVDFSSATKYVYHTVGLYLLYLRDVKKLPLKITVKKNDQSTEESDAKQPKQPTKQTSNGNKPTSTTDNSAAKTTKPEDEGETSNPALERVFKGTDPPTYRYNPADFLETDAQIIKEVLEHIRATRPSPEYYRIPCPLPFSSPYTARQWFNGTIQIWTQLLFWCGVLAVFSQLRETVTEWRELDASPMTHAAFQQNLATFKNAAPGQFALLSSLERSLENIYSQKKSLWSKRQSFFETVNFAIPLFGLLGTVAGISGAFEKAPAFIRAEGDPLKQEGAMALLATSVSMAFFTTLVACYLALVFYFLQKAVAAIESTVLRRLAHRCRNCIAMIQHFVVVPRKDWCLDQQPETQDVFEAFTGTSPEQWCPDYDDPASQEAGYR